MFTTSNDLVSSLENSTVSSNSADASQQTGSNLSNSSSPSDQLAVYQASLLAQQSQPLFSTGPAVGSDTSTVNLLA